MPAFFEKSYEPLPVADLSKVVGIVSGANHTVVLTHEGTVFAWGSNATGQLGRSDDMGCQVAEEEIPTNVNEVHIEAHAGGGILAKAVSSSNESRLIIRVREENGEEIDAKAMTLEQMQNRVTNHGVLIVEMPDRNVPKDEKQALLVPHQMLAKDEDALGVHTSAECTFLRFSSGAYGGGLRVSAALLADGQVYTWGRAEECGHGANFDSPPILRPCVVRGLPRIRSLRCGVYHTLACSKDGDVFAWGGGLTYQLGNRPRDSNDPVDKDEEPTDEALPYLLSSKQLESRYVLSADGGAQHSVEFAWNGSYSELPIPEQRKVP